MKMKLETRDIEQLENTSFATAFAGGLEGVTDSEAVTGACVSVDGHDACNSNACASAADDSCNSNICASAGEGSCNTNATVCVSASVDNCLCASVAYCCNDGGDLTDGRIEWNNHAEGADLVDLVRRS